MKVHVGLQLARQLQPQLEQLVQQCDSKLAAAGEAAVGFWPPAVKLRAARNAALGLLSYMEDRQLQQQLLQRCAGKGMQAQRIRCGMRSSGLYILMVPNDADSAVAYHTKCK